MSARDWYPGQHVVCVDNRDSCYPDTFAVPNEGCVYTVRDAFECPVSGIVIRLKEIRNPNAFIRSMGRTMEPGYSVTRFRPLDESRLDIFRKALKKQPKNEDA